MNSKHQKILNEILKKPISKKLKFRDIESLLIHVGCKMKQGSGSRVSFHLGDEEFHCHKPHPNPEVLPYVIKNLREFLDRIGVK